MSCLMLPGNFSVQSFLDQWSSLNPSFSLLYLSHDPITVLELGAPVPEYLETTSIVLSFSLERTIHEKIPIWDLQRTTFSSKIISIQRTTFSFNNISIQRTTFSFNNISIQWTTFYLTIFPFSGQHSLNNISIQRTTFS